LKTQAARGIASLLYPESKQGKEEKKGQQIVESTYHQSKGLFSHLSSQGIEQVGLMLGRVSTSKHNLPSTLPKSLVAILQKFLNFEKRLAYSALNGILSVPEKHPKNLGNMLWQIE
jgi:hypothetical protein